MPVAISAIFYDGVCEEALAAVDLPEAALFNYLGLKQPYPYASFQCQSRIANPLYLTPLSMDIGHNYVNLIGAGNDLALTPTEWQSLQRLLAPLLLSYHIKIHSRQFDAIILETTIENNAPPWFALKSNSFMDCMPTGSTKTFWQRLQTESQMLLNQADFNFKRAQLGKPQVNAVWFWGQGDWQFDVCPMMLVTDNDYLIAQVEMVNHIELLSVEQFMTLKPKKLKRPVTIYLKKAHQTLLKKLYKFTYHGSIEIIWQNGQQQISKKKRFWFW